MSLYTHQKDLRFNFFSIQGAHQPRKPEILREFILPQGKPGKPGKLSEF